MTEQEHKNALRRREDWELVDALAQRQPWFEARCISEPNSQPSVDGVPHRIEISIEGKGIKEAGTARDDFEILEKHQVQIEFPDDYPHQPPKIQFISPLFHPNVPAGGLVNLDDLGLSWQPEMTLDIICERIWDVIRGAFIELDSVSNIGAGQWYSAQSTIQWPIDPRPLALPETNFDNVIKYRRKPARGSRPRNKPTRPQTATSSEDVLYIHDNESLRVDERRKSISDDRDQPNGTDVHLIR